MYSGPVPECQIWLDTAVSSNHLIFPIFNISFLLFFPERKGKNKKSWYACLRRSGEIVGWGLEAGEVGGQHQLSFLHLAPFNKSQFKVAESLNNLQQKCSLTPIFETCCALLYRLLELHRFHPTGTVQGIQLYHPPPPISYKSTP